MIKLTNVNAISLITFAILLMNQNCIIGQTQKKLEEDWAKACFRKHYKPVVYPKFTGQITVIDTNTFKFDEKTLIVYDLNIGFRYLLENGIFYPNIITGNVIAELKTDHEIEQMPVVKRIIYNASRIDRLSISGFEEIESLSKSPKRKRLIFYLFKPGSMNPNICFLELTNESASKDWSFEEFVKDCRVTYFEIGSVLI